jgi:hypothetical protein
LEGAGLASDPKSRVYGPDDRQPTSGSPTDSIQLRSGGLLWMRQIRVQHSLAHLYSHSQSFPVPFRYAPLLLQYLVDQSLGVSYYWTQNAAGIYQAFGIGKYTQGIPLLLFPYGDSAADAAIIQQGFTYEVFVGAGCRN